MADGHAEHKRWNSPKQFINYHQPVAGKQDAEDLVWLRHRIPATQLGKYD
jgi:hypothetical protein